MKLIVAFLLVACSLIGLSSAWALTQTSEVTDPKALREARDVVRAAGYDCPCVNLLYYRHDRTPLGMEYKVYCGPESQPSVYYDELIYRVILHPDTSRVRLVEPWDR